MQRLKKSSFFLTFTDLHRFLTKTLTYGSFHFYLIEKKKLVDCQTEEKKTNCCCVLVLTLAVTAYN